jgi:hypothetical protein
MNSRGRINCLAKVVWRVVHSRLQRGLPPRSRQSGASGGRGVVLSHGRRLLLHCVR